MQDRVVPRVMVVPRVIKQRPHADERVPRALGVRVFGSGNIEEIVGIVDVAERDRQVAVRQGWPVRILASALIERAWDRGDAPTRTFGDNAPQVSTTIS